jgi:hypothetical protein
MFSQSQNRSCIVRVGSSQTSTITSKVCIMTFISRKATSPSTGNLGSEPVEIVSLFWSEDETRHLPD